MSTIVDGGSYLQGMYPQSGMMMPMNAALQNAGQQENVYGGEYYSPVQYCPGGGYSGYGGYAVGRSGGNGNAGGSEATGAGPSGGMMHEIGGMQPTVVDSSMMMNGGAPYSFIMPAGGQDAGMHAFQQSFGGNYPFYDTNAYGAGTMMPQGFVAGYEHLPTGETKKAVKKNLAKKDVPSARRTGKAKTLFPCC